MRVERLIEFWFDQTNVLPVRLAYCKQHHTYYVPWLMKLIRSAHAETLRSPCRLACHRGDCIIWCSRQDTTFYASWNSLTLNLTAAPSGIWDGIHSATLLSQDGTASLSAPIHPGIFSGRGQGTFVRRASHPRSMKRHRVHTELPHPTRSDTNPTINGVQYFFVITSDYFVAVVYAPIISAGHPLPGEGSQFCTVIITLG